MWENVHGTYSEVEVACWLFSVHVSLKALLSCYGFTQFVIMVSGVTEILLAHRPNWRVDAVAEQ